MDTITDNYLNLLSFLKEDRNRQSFEDCRMVAIEERASEPELIALLSKDKETVTIIQQTKSGKVNYEQFPYTKLGKSGKEPIANTVG